MFPGSILKDKQRRYLAKKRRTNQTIKATASFPRLLVIRSLTHISAQVIGLDGQVLAAATDHGMKGTKTEKAFAVGKLIAGSAKKNGVDQVVFDRNGRIYHGRVAQLAAGAREGGLQF
jgi:large subunit ribosomal protein L18